jgi:hypothetical protein
VHPARERPLVAVLVILFVTAIGVLAGQTIGLAWASWLFAAILLGSISSFLLPTTYELDEAGITVRHALTARRRLRKQIRRVDIGSEAALLSPYRTPRRLDRFRALLVPLRGAPPEALALLRRFPEPAGE